MANLMPDTVQPLTRAAWRAWLEAHHARDSGIWLVYFKKASGQPRVPYADAVEEALCFGWVDSTQRKLDDDRSMLYFAPRKKGSGWSKVNKARIERLMADGRMAPAGLAKIEAAKADGSWELLDAVEALKIPDDLARAFDAYPGSRQHFEAFPPSAKRALLGWIVLAKRPETRAKRVDETARLAADNIRANQWQPKQPPIFP